MVEPSTMSTRIRVNFGEYILHQIHTFPENLAVLITMIIFSGFYIQKSIVKLMNFMKIKNIQSLLFQGAFSKPQNWFWTIFLCNMWNKVVIIDFLEFLYPYFILLVSQLNLLLRKATYNLLLNYLWYNRLCIEVMKNGQ